MLVFVLHGYNNFKKQLALVLVLIIFAHFVVVVLLKKAVL